MCPSLPWQCLHKFVLPSSIKCLNICPLEGGWLNWWRLFKLLRNKDGQGKLPTHKTTIVRSTRRCLPKLSWQTMKGDNSTLEAMAKENVLTLCGSERERERQMRCRAECWKTGSMTMKVSEGENNFNLLGAVRNLRLKDFHKNNLMFILSGDKWTSILSPQKPTG